MLLKEPDKQKYYPVRAGNDLKYLKQWINKVKKQGSKQKLVILNDYKLKMKIKENQKYWKFRFNSPLNLENKYIVYGSYK